MSMFRRYSKVMSLGLYIIATRVYCTLKKPKRDRHCLIANVMAFTTERSVAVTELQMEEHPTDMDIVMPLTHACCGFLSQMEGVEGVVIMLTLVSIWKRRRT